MRLTSLNVEQSIARYLADQFLAAGYRIYWWDSQQSEGSTGDTVTFVRDFPETPTNIVPQSTVQEDHLIRVPAFAVNVFVNPRATVRQGIGEGSFEWRTDVRIDGFADNELQWYRMRSLFTDWISHPDVRVDLRDYQADLTNPNPPVEDEKVQFENATVLHQELYGNDIPDAARYYVGVSATAVFIE